MLRNIKKTTYHSWWFICNIPIHYYELCFPLKCRHLNTSKWWSKIKRCPVYSQFKGLNKMEKMQLISPFISLWWGKLEVIVKWHWKQQISRAPKGTNSTTQNSKRWLFPYPKQKSIPGVIFLTPVTVIRIWSHMKTNIYIFKLYFKNHGFHIRFTCQVIHVSTELQV